MSEGFPTLQECVWRLGASKAIDDNTTLYHKAAEELKSARSRDDEIRELRRVIAFAVANHTSQMGGKCTCGQCTMFRETLAKYPR